MDILFKELQNELMHEIRKFMNDETTTKELITKAKEFDLIFKLNDNAYLERMKEEIFNFYKNEYQSILEVDRMYRKYNHGIEIEVDVNKLISQAKRFGSVRISPYGLTSDSKFKGPYPNEEEINNN
ncbi:hypothetical protein TUBRATIS_002090 [Tubulinosema ratisbonensis]|uniref:Uncharacterized protein n=1 Tax=Tubulinosema ratisbonensis TaxID=291195 RepID=A0A437AQM2_9MICR|nr:hypothetical protein TUBRATIS_002090 [Tubulinosema ratisbonensis]